MQVESDLHVGGRGGAQAMQVNLLETNNNALLIALEVTALMGFSASEVFANDKNWRGVGAAK